MNLLKNNKPIFYALAGVLVLAGIAYLNFFMYVKIKSLSFEIAGAEGKIAALEKKEHELNKAASDIKISEKKINTLKNVFLSESKFVDFVKILETLSGKSKVKVTVEGAKLPATAVTEPASAVLKLEGGFLQIANFAILLDEIPYAGLIESATIAPQKVSGEGTAQTQLLQAKINYLIFNLQK